VTAAPRAPIKRTRNAAFVRSKAKLRAQEQRAFDQAARRLVAWGRSR
jgi:hypothetical protein